MYQSVGADVYINSKDLPDLPKEHGSMKLLFISNRGTKSWPGPPPDIDFIENWRCRYESEVEVTQEDVDSLAAALTKAGFHWTRIQRLYTEAGERQYSQPY